MTDRTTYVTHAGVRRRGWTDTMVRDLLGTPDVQGRDPRRWSLTPLRLYLLARVETVERTPEFADTSASPARSAAAVAYAGRRRAAVLAAIRAEPIEVPRLPGPELERRAVRHRKLLGAHGAGDGPPVAGALVRWQVGYLRHALSRYEALLDGLYGETGRGEAERLLRRRLYEAIAAAYPPLAQECRRRIAVER
ncbi:MULTISPECIES: hypothetical protein [Streptomyces]|uniref:Uncharacterized protein n=1 Tax=Streptomyces venezuelae (strain ATCC 10712 / CBS 650.69 / DSM 40230 / JCM 4526 / NBRC 13096 / PD 04745) TaxID=953739 RepID=F2RCD3_STRVP|nr:hypothetical protein [Streptomyces venezuelae]APE24866.1 hypothetical protein vnz_30115 [Streptomyces venezuelae]QES02211.1 hypothetical protein DEJ43_30600 [Streptomyces venezuelae ATCC 10712]QES12164.1 hypothetical protein DEJ45_06965 [Streptomyces venezuelae]CCA59384.1 hypothetical protein SVEN_6098 [Streptomyces venezuelae ATCC 10712]